MGGDRVRGNKLMDRFLKLESLNPQVDFGVGTRSLLNGLKTEYGRIENRICELVFVANRDKLRQRINRVKSSMETRNFEGEILVYPDTQKCVLSLSGSDGVRVEDKRTYESSKGFKRDRSHLVGKALKMMDYEIKKVDKEGGGSFYDCNLCLNEAKDPVLTCCGHMFCWVCFYVMPYVNSSTKECPICQGEVSDTTLLPVYGNGSSEHVSELECGFEIPPRPKARRVESSRQQGFALSLNLSYASVIQALRQIRGVTEMANHRRHEDGTGNFNVNSEFPILQNAEAQGNHPLMWPTPMMLPLPETPASLSNHGTLIDSQFQASEARPVSVTDLASPLLPSILQWNHLPPYSRVERNSTFSISSSSQARGVSGAVAHFGTSSTSRGINLNMDPSPSSWRRIIRQGAPYFNNGDFVDLEED